MFFWIAVLSLQASPAVALPLPLPPQGTIQPASPLSTPTDWSMLPPLAYRSEPQVTPAMQNFVGGEIRSGRCKPVAHAFARGTLTLELAVLVAPNGFIRRVVPRAIDCMTVEQYGAGLVTGFARGNLRQRIAGSDAWHKATLVFGPPPAKAAPKALPTK